MASTAALGVISSITITPSSSLRLSTLRRLPFLRTSATAAASTEFNITFAPPSPKPHKELPKTLVPDPQPSPNDPSAAPVPALPLLIPWIVRDESGNLHLQSTPPARFLHAIADTKKPPKNKDNVSRKKKSSASAAAALPSSAPKYSKAARRFYNENIREPQRLSKVLATAGVASRRSSEELIFEGRVTVNGTVCTSPQTRVDILKDSIYVNGNRISRKLPPKLYFAVNKPKGYICSCGEESKSVISLFDEYMKNWSKTYPGLPKPRLFTVGRLDVATTGLIIVTNDGDFAQRLAHPSSNLSKEYIAAVEGSVHKKHLIAISDGTQVDGVPCVPDSVELLAVQPDTSRPRLRIVVHEGRNHEVRELVKNAGLQIHSLKRVRIGGFRLPSDLGLGKHAELKQADLKVLGWTNQKSSLVKTP